MAGGPHHVGVHKKRRGPEDRKPGSPWYESMRKHWAKVGGSGGFEKKKIEPVLIQPFGWVKLPANTIVTYVRTGKGEPLAAKS
jgi:hypothetical protein